MRTLLATIQWVLLCANVKRALRAMASSAMISTSVRDPNTTTETVMPTAQTLLALTTASVPTDSSKTKSPKSAMVSL